jgi:hypothetical protein
MVPVTSEDKEKIDSLKENQILHCEAIKKRNIKFHRKFMALVSYAYDLFEPPDVEVNGTVITGTKDFNEFRKWLTVKAGYHDVIGYPDGSVRLRAKSISFAKMDEEQFSQLYSNCIDVILRYICATYSQEDLENSVANVMGYT